MTAADDGKPVSESWSVNDLERAPDGYECNHTSGCKEDAGWDIQLVNRHGQNGLVRSCDEHLEVMYGCPPERAANNRIEEEGDV